MKKFLLFILIIFIICIGFTGCKGSDSETTGTNNNSDTASDINTANKEAFEECETVLGNLLTYEMNYDFYSAFQQYWDESLNTFSIEYEDFYNPEHFNNTNFELVEYKILDYTDVPNHFNIEAREYQIGLKYYWYGELNEETHNYYMIFVPEQGWKVSYNGYIGKNDLGFMESRVSYNTNQEFDVNDLVSKMIKFAPRELIYTTNSTFLSMDIVPEFSGNEGTRMFSSSYENPKQFTSIVIEEGSSKISGVMDYSEVYKQNSSYSPTVTLENTNMIIDLGYYAEEPINPEKIYIEDYINKNDAGFSLYDITIMEDGEFLNQQRSILTGSYRYNEEIFVPEKSYEISSSNINNTSINLTGNKNNGGLIAIKGDWSYFNENAFAKQNINTGEFIQINNDIPKSLNVCGDYIYYVNNADGCIYRYNTISDTTEKLTENMKIENIQIIDNWLYYYGQNNIGRIDVNFENYFEPIVAGNIHYFNVQGDYVYYLLQADGGFENDKICRTKIGDKDRTKELLYEEIYNEGPAIDQLADILVDENYIFLVDYDYFGTIYRMNLDGTNIIDLIDGSDYVTSINMDDESIYYVLDLGYLYKVSKEGGTSTCLAERNEIRNIHLFNDYISYFVDSKLIDFVLKDNKGVRVSNENLQPKNNEGPVITASSYLSENFNGSTLKHLVNNLADNDITTAWVEGAAGTGIGEWVNFQYKEEKSISSISLINGLTKTENLYKQNTRVKEIKLEFSNGEVINAKLSDDIMDFQEIKLETPIVTKSVKFTITDVYPGSEFEDTCISEILILK